MGNTSLANLAKKQEDIRNQVKLLAQESVEPALRTAFEDLKKVIPNLTGIRWTQYTPHFNDGDVCEFGLHGVDIQLDDGDFDYVSNYESAFNKTTGLNSNGLTKAQADAFGDFEENLNGIEEMLKVAFDDHAQVTINATDIEVEEYEHD